jgi:Uma2 family endonuclease
VRHELVGGETFAMVGATGGHHRVVRTLMRRMEQHLEGGPCEVFSESMRLQIDENVVYPDLFVACGRRPGDGDAIAVDPVLVIEVLSPSTAAYDLGRKASIYRGAASLRELVLVDPVARTVQVYRRHQAAAAGEWTFAELRLPEESLELASVELTMSVASVFERLGPQAPDATDLR